MKLLPPQLILTTRTCQCKQHTVYTAATRRHRILAIGTDKATVIEEALFNPKSPTWQSELDRRTCRRQCVPRHSVAV